jgi:hypothetical protein
MANFPACKVEVSRSALRGRGQLAHVTFTDEHRFAVAEKVQVTACYFENCRMGMAEIMRQATTHLYAAATGVGHTAARLKDLLHDPERSRARVGCTERCAFRAGKLMPGRAVPTTVAEAARR